MDITSGNEERDNIVLQAGDSINAGNLSGNELGIVNLVSGTFGEEDPSLVGDIATESITGKRLKVESSGSFTASADINTNDGNVVVDAKQDITIENITANNGNVRLTSEEKSITAKDISTIIPEVVGDEETTRKGNIILKAIENINAGNLNANELGKIEITSGKVEDNDTETVEDDTILVGDISTQSITGKAVRAVGTGSFTATGDITAHDGKITVAVMSDVNTKNINSLARSINLISTEGAVTVEGDLNSEKGGVAIHAANNVTAQKIRSFNGVIGLSSYQGSVIVEGDINTVRGSVTIAAQESLSVAGIITGIGAVSLSTSQGNIEASGDISTNKGYVDIKTNGEIDLQSVSTNNGFINIGAIGDVATQNLTTTDNGVINLTSINKITVNGNISTDGNYVRIETNDKITNNNISTNDVGIDVNSFSNLGEDGTLVANNPGLDVSSSTINPEDLSSEQEQVLTEFATELLYSARPIGEFTLGVFYQWAANNLEDLVNAGQIVLPDFLKLTDADRAYWNNEVLFQSKAFKLGAELGNAASIVQGIIEFITGAVGTFGGGGLCFTGIGCVAGAPAVVAGLAVQAHGLAVIKNGLENDTDANLIRDLLSPQKMQSNSGSSLGQGKVYRSQGGNLYTPDDAIDLIDSKENKVLELFGGKTGQIDDAINIDLIAERGIEADILKDKLSFVPDNSIDEIVTFNPFIPKNAGGTGILDYLPEAARVLKPGSEIIISGTKNNKFTKIKASLDLESLGLEVVAKQIPLPERFSNMEFRRINGSILDNDTILTTILRKVEQ